ncbi:Glycosyltransferase involved in cell wall bisynthesis [Abditibacterium utsteinense]|uniref:Glycosyltransferase involved in cell wall bisynthesis n=1 Tax=Abditibacterium utsteinense TaxID=1960156 RepID=A0A2S8SS73_9BACT|nr:glycosyltransferase [Abditibacterium utsteinense]PQV63626.1 Glycosyltransferase involved in cell wall bisynthesis [Abditibacterium utsteinense]
MFASSFPIIVHCHLRWDFVWQRPQQFLSRLSKKHRVLFVEGPLLHKTEAAPSYELKVSPEYPNVTVMQISLPASRFSDGVWVDAQRRKLVEEAIRGPLAGRFERSVQWFYDPMAVEAHLGQHGAIGTVYDCMDELAQFKSPPAGLVERERRLLRAADVVFAGGRKMCESKSRFNSNAHFYGCGVDVAHFGKARSASTEIPAELAELNGPILGYFGVVDERLDYDLIEKLALANTDWHIAMIGPVAKVNPADFPRLSNIHWLGGRDYSQLPAYTKAFDVALMPFALNEATEYINPTKALEYMATATPIVSTPVPDVVSNFASVVKISGDSDEFIKICASQISQTDQIAVERGLKMAADNTWDAIVAKLEKHVEEALVRKSVMRQSEVNQLAVSAA